MKKIFFACIFVAPTITYGASLVENILPPVDPFGNLVGTVDGDYLYSGDIIYPSTVSGFGASVNNTWPDGVVWFDFSSDIASDQDKVDAIIDACNSWADDTPISCKNRDDEADPGTTAPHYILVDEHNGTKCGLPATPAGMAREFFASCSMLGYWRRADQPLWIDETHWTNTFVLRHEIGHALGLIHEHQRPDRDRYVIYRESNTPEHARSNFEVSNLILKVATDYDYRSIMHYSNCQISIHDDCAGDDTKMNLLRSDCGLPIGVGPIGDTITSLDKDAITLAYGGEIAAAFPRSRDPSCGSIAYSKADVEEICGTNCQFATNVTWSRLDWRLEKNSCGPIALAPASYFEEFCENNYAQEYFPPTRIRDIGMCTGLDGLLRREYWRDVQCGCTSQELTSLCSQDTGQIDPTYISKLTDTNVVNFLEYILELKSYGLVDNSVSASLGNWLVENSANSSLGAILKTYQAFLRIYINGKLKSNASFQLQKSQFVEFFERTIRHLRI